MAMTPEQRRMRAQHAAFVRWSKEDPSANAARGQAGLLRKFENEVDPNWELPEAERLRRAEAARQAHMIKLRYRSSRSRSGRKDGGA